MRIKFLYDVRQAQLARMTAGAFGMVSVLTALDKFGITAGDGPHRHILIGVFYLGAGIYFLKGAFTGQGAYFDAARDRFEKERIKALGAERYAELTNDDAIKSVQRALRDNTPQ